MEKTRYISGPWKIGHGGPNKNDPIFYRIDVLNSSRMLRVARVSGVGSTAAEANACLITAAPDYDDSARWAEKILTAYLEAESREERDYYYKDIEHARDRLRAAIAKAEGRE